MTQGLPDVLEQAMRVYAMLGALLIVLIELELERLLWLFRFAEYWIGRSQVQVGPVQSTSRKLLCAASDLYLMSCMSCIVYG